MADLNDGSLKTSLEGKSEPQDAEILELQSHEEEFTANYLKHVAPTHPRYSRLGNFNADAPTELTDHFMVWDFMRVVRLMRAEAEIYPAYRSLLELTARCSFDDYLRGNPFIQWAAVQPMRKYYHYADPSFVSKMITDMFEPLGVDTSDWSMDFGTRGRLAFYERFGTPTQSPPLLRSLHVVDALQT